MFQRCDPPPRAIAALAAACALALAAPTARAQTPTPCTASGAHFDVAPMTIDPTSKAAKWTYATLSMIVSSDAGCVLRARLLDDGAPIPPNGLLVPTPGVRLQPKLNIGQSITIDGAQYGYVIAPAGTQTVSLRWFIQASTTGPRMASAGWTTIRTGAAWSVAADANPGLPGSDDRGENYAPWTLTVAPGFQMSVNPLCGNASGTVLAFARLAIGQQTCSGFNVASNDDVQLTFASANGGRIVHASETDSSARYKVEIVWPDAAGKRVIPLFDGAPAAGTIRLGPASGDGRFAFTVTDVDGVQFAGRYSDQVTIEISAR